MSGPSFQSLSFTSGLQRVLKVSSPHLPRYPYTQSSLLNIRGHLSCNEKLRRNPSIPGISCAFRVLSPNQSSMGPLDQNRGFNFLQPTSAS